MKTDIDPVIAEKQVDWGEPERTEAAFFIPHSDLLLAIPLLSLLATLIWVMFGNEPDAPEYPPLKGPSAPVNAPQHPGAPQER